ncbi:hypothetical protein [Myroides odoratus]|uniref:hypothetical protein n=1 Tax=Myroides odoratus TaxID=256 RepID=UPI0039B0F8E7
MNKKTYLSAFVACLLAVSCQDKTETKDNETPTSIKKQVSIPEDKQPSFVLSPDHKINTITLDIDGDGKPDHIQIVKSTSDNQYGITIQKGNGNFDIIGPLEGAMYNVLPEDMVDLTWAQDVSVAEKNTVIYEVTDDNGDLRSEEDVPEDEKTTLPYESLHLSVPESCGSGLLYWLDGTYHWHQTS